MPNIILSVSPHLFFIHISYVFYAFYQPSISIELVKNMLPQPNLWRDFRHQNLNLKYFYRVLPGLVRPPLYRASLVQCWERTFTKLRCLNWMHPMTGDLHTLYEIKRWIFIIITCIHVITFYYLLFIVPTL